MIDSPKLVDTLPAPLGAAPPPSPLPPEESAVPVGAPAPKRVVPPAPPPEPPALPAPLPPKPTVVVGVRENAEAEFEGKPVAEGGIIP